MQRHAMPYRGVTEEGLYFIAFSRSLQELENSLKRMAGQEAEVYKVFKLINKWKDGSSDKLLSITKAVTSNFYYTPSLMELKRLGEQDKLEFKEKAEVKVNYAYWLLLNIGGNGKEGTWR